MPSKFGDRDDLGLALTFLRWLKGWTQEQTVAAAGVSLQGLRALEQGRRRRPTLKTLGLITSALGSDLASVAEVITLIRRLRDGAVVSAASGGGFAWTSGLTMNAAFDFRRKVTDAALAAAGCGGPVPAAGRKTVRQQAPGVGGGEELGLAITLLRWLRKWEQEDLAAEAGVPIGGPARATTWACSTRRGCSASKPRCGGRSAAYRRRLQRSTWGSRSTAGARPPLCYWGKRGL
jgi:DNA-binding XRE family transcriptional regulator